MRLGIFGGSFNPIHFGHLLLAEACREQCQLDQIWFVPAAIAPHKQREAAALPRHRVEMLELAIAGHPDFAVSTIELDRGGVSYTVETLSAAAKQEPDAKLFFLMGADSLNDLPSWREPQRICELAIPLVVRRSGEPPIDLTVLAPLIDSDRLAEIESHMIEAPLIELSSTDIRNRVASGRTIRFRTPRAVERYILEHALYSPSDSEFPS